MVERAGALPRGHPGNGQDDFLFFGRAFSFLFLSGQIIIYFGIGPRINWYNDPMNGTYRKRRRNTGPSKNEEKVSRSKQIENRNRSSNSLGARYPLVSQLTICLDFLGPQQQVLGQEKRVFSSLDICNFSTPCPGKCGVGEFDLAAKIDLVIAAHELVSESSGVCQERLYVGSRDICGCQLKCRLDIVYLPEDAQETSIE